MKDRFGKSLILGDHVHILGGRYTNKNGIIAQLHKDLSRDFVTVHFFASNGEPAEGPRKADIVPAYYCQRTLEGGAHTLAQIQ